MESDLVLETVRLPVAETGDSKWRDGYMFINVDGQEYIYIVIGNPPRMAILGCNTMGSLGSRVYGDQIWTVRRENDKTIITQSRIRDTLVRAIRNYDVDIADSIDQIVSGNVPPTFVSAWTGDDGIVYVLAYTGERVYAVTIIGELIGYDRCIVVYTERETPLVLRVFDSRGGQHGCDANDRFAKSSDCPETGEWVIHYNESVIASVSHTAYLGTIAFIIDGEKFAMVYNAANGYRVTGVMITADPCALPIVDDRRLMTRYYQDITDRIRTHCGHPLTRIYSCTNPYIFLCVCGEGHRSFVTAYHRPNAQGQLSCAPSVVDVSKLTSM